MRQTTKEKISKRTVDIAFEIVATDEWVETVENQFASVVNDLWALIQRGENNSLCPALAEQASQLIQFGEDVKSLAGLAAARIVGWFKRSHLEQELARRFVKAVVPAPFETPRQAAARCLRVCGIWICISSGKPLRGCQCLRDLAQGMTQEAIQVALDRKLNDLRPNLSI